MGNAPGKAHARERTKKYLLLKGAEPPSPPGKPYLVSTDDVLTPDVLTIRWNASENHGGTTLTGYYVEHRRSGSPHWVKAAPNKVTSCELTLSGLEPGWRYQFRIFAENLVGLSNSSDLSEPLTVTHQRSAIVAPKFTRELQDLVALENNKVEFVSYFVGQPAPKICWFKDGFEIFSSRRTRILTELDRSILTIHQSALSDEGEIKCTATNKAGHVSTRARLILEAPPCIRLPRQYEDGLLFEIGELVRLKVSIAGLPRPLVFWSHDGEEINERERYEIENDSNSSTLKITEAMRGDRGEYQIRAVNKLGSDIASFLVTVTDKPSPPGSAKVVMSLGRSVTLSWNTPQDDGGCKIGNYIVEYYRLGWNVWLKAATTKQLSTILGDLIEGSEYKFRVKAESPFGVSEPSHETDLVFIPDPKRGMLEPRGGRGRSQPTDIIDDLVPVAAKRRKGRSQSSPRDLDDAEEDTVGSPPRPRRTKFSSPQPKSPEFSPKPERKAASLNRAIFDRDSMFQDLSYGSPDIRVTRSNEPVSSPPLPPSVVAAPVAPSIAPVAEVKPMQQSSKKLQLNPIPDSVDRSIVNRSAKDRSPSPSHYVQKGDTHKFVKDKPANPRKPLSRDNSENLGGSTEFMMVLYTEEVKDDGTSLNHFEDMSVPPPLSLSAPELGIEPPQLFDPIKYSASSTELLHERAMVRFYNEALAEEEAIQRKMERQGDRKSSLIPKIQINNPDEQDITNLERKHSLRRRLSAGGTIPQNILNTQKRHSLRRSGDFTDLFGSDFLKQNLTAEDRRSLMHNRQRSTSEEKEEEEFERIRAKMATQNPVAPKKNISVVPEDVWEEEDYIESLSEEEFSDNESIREDVKIREIFPEEEDETYHPQMTVKSKFEAPFEILTKPAKLPDANFVPKPILKKKDGEKSPPTSGSEVESDYKPRSRSNSLIDDYLDIQAGVPKGYLEEKKGEWNTSAIASAGLTAAGIVISQPILHKNEEEESKSVIDHYGEIVRSQTSKSLRGLEDNPVRAALKKQAQMQARLHYSDEEEEVEAPQVATKMFDPPLILAPIVKKSKGLEERLKYMERKMEEQRAKEAKETKEQVPKASTSPGKSRDEVYPKMAKGPEPVKGKDRLVGTQEGLSRGSGSPGDFKEGPPRGKDKPPGIPEGPSRGMDRPGDFKEGPPRGKNKSGDTKEEPPRRGREETRFGKRSVSTSKSPHRSSERRRPTKSPGPLSRPLTSTPTIATPTISAITSKTSGTTSTTSTTTSSTSTPPERSTSKPRGPSRPGSRSTSQTRSTSSTRPPSRSNSSMRPPSRSTSRPRPERKSQSPGPMNYLRKPKMCEIMTQTSTTTEPLDFAIAPSRSQRDADLKAIAVVKVRNTMDYITDLAMFAVVFWVFLFSNELLAIPFLLLAVFRQLQDELKRWIPQWVKKRWNKPKKDQ